MGTLIAIVGVAVLALAFTLLRGPWQGGAVVLGGILMGLGVWIQRRPSIDTSAATSDDRDKDYLPGYIGGDPRPWLEKHGAESPPTESDTPSHHD